MKPNECPSLYIVSRVDNGLCSKKRITLGSFFIHYTTWGLFLYKAIVYFLTVYKNISTQSLIAVAAIKIAKMICNAFTFIFFPTIAPSGAAIKLATIIIAAG